MNIGKFARKLVLKYATELFDPNAGAADLITTLKNNLKDIFKTEFARAELLNPDPEDREGEEVEKVHHGNFYQLKLKFDEQKSLAPSNVKDKINTNMFLNKIEKKFAAIIDGIDDKDVVQINAELIDFLEFLEKVTPLVNDSINLNHYIRATDRKHLFGTFQKVIDNLKFKVRKQVEFISRGRGPAKWEKEEKRLMPEVALPTVTPLPDHRFQLPSGTELTKRKRMLQTNPQTQKFIFEYGPLYGINSERDWGKLVEKDFEAAEQLMTAFLGMKRHHFAYKDAPDYKEGDPKNAAKEQAELKSLVRGGLKAKINEVLNPVPQSPLPFGPLPKRPPGK